MALTREQIFGKVDISVKEIDVPEWGDSVFIRQLTRGEQDAYLKRQYGATMLKQDTRAKAQEIKGMSLYGHDAFLCVCGICDESGKSIFSAADIAELEKKNGEVIGRIALEIIKFSGMAGDVKQIDELKN